MGGRQQHDRTEVSDDYISDHFAVDFEYPSGARMMSMCRQIVGTRSSVGEHFIGTKGSSKAAGEITGPEAWE